MAIDSSIFQLAGRGVKSVADYDNEASQGRQNKLAEMMGGMKMDEYTRGVADQNALRGVYAQFGNDTAANTNALFKAGLGKEAGAYAKSAQDMAKDKAATEKDQLANTHAKLSLGGQLLSSAKDQSSYDAARATAQANGLDVSRMPAQFDPAFVAAKMQESQTLKEQLEQKWKAMQYSTPDANAVLSAQTSTSNNAATNATSRANNSASVGATMRGQNMADGRSREALEAGRQQIVQTDNGPVLVNTRTGAGQVVNGPDGQPLPGVTKPLNDSQSKALLFGSRMREADKVLDTLSGEGKINSIAGSRSPYVGGVINAMSSDNNQMLNQAKTDFMTAQLRRESGAAISTGEFDTSDKQYFPQVGDAPGVIAQKASNRQLAMRGILMEVPEKQRGSLQPSGPASGIDSLLDKYK